MANGGDFAVRVFQHAAKRQVAVAVFVDGLLDPVDQFVGKLNVDADAVAAGLEVLERRRTRPHLEIGAHAAGEQGADHNICHGKQRSAESHAMHVDVFPGAVPYDFGIRGILGDFGDADAGGAQGWP